MTGRRRLALLGLAAGGLLAALLLGSTAAARRTALDGARSEEASPGPVLRGRGAAPRRAPETGTRAGPEAGDEAGGEAGATDAAWAVEVRGPEGGPAPGRTVELLDRWGQVLRVGVTDAQGTWRVAPYALGARLRPAYVRLPDPSGRPSRARLVPVTTVDTALEVRLHPTIDLTGRVVDLDSGAPLGGARLAFVRGFAAPAPGPDPLTRATDAGLPGVEARSTGPDGRFVLPDTVPDAEGLLLVAAPPPGTWTVGRWIVSGGREIVLGVARARGVQVVDEEGGPVPGARLRQERLRAWRTAWDATWSGATGPLVWGLDHGCAWTGADGFAPLAAPAEPTVLGVEPAREPAGVEEAFVRRGAGEGVQVTLVRPRRVRGRVVHPPGLPVNVACLWWDGAGEEGPARLRVRGTDRGVFELDVPARRAWLKAVPREASDFGVLPRGAQASGTQRWHEVRLPLDGRELPLEEPRESEHPLRVALDRRLDWPLPVDLWIGVHGQDGVLLETSLGLELGLTFAAVPDAAPELLERVVAAPDAASRLWAYAEVLGGHHGYAFLEGLAPGPGLQVLQAAPAPRGDLALRVGAAWEPVACELEAHADVGLCLPLEAAYRELVRFQAGNEVELPGVLPRGLPLTVHAWVLCRDGQVLRGRVRAAADGRTLLEIP